MKTYKVRQSGYGRVLEKDADTIFTPGAIGGNHDYGALERVSAEVEAENMAIGRLIAALHEKGILSYEEAAEISDSRFTRVME